MDQLRNLLAEISANDENYAVRNTLVFEAVAVAARCGLAAGFRIDPNEPAWPVAFIELPTGQVSWHTPEHSTPWDGHTTEEKYQRVQAWIDAQPTEQDERADLMMALRSARAENPAYWNTSDGLAASENT